MSQTTDILAHLSKGKRITPLEALERFGSLRLGARIKDLEYAGYTIERRDKTDAKTGKRFREYWMDNG